ncbi:hypothetical protein [Henriciella litoralis]|uniref:hypothetical protein n=1 Tax=Henriciella litoralis TaxID=568102 RepID=UPI000A032B26|nr:hypothetical protein [Henriciella litoralis]
MTRSLLILALALTPVAIAKADAPELAAFEATGPKGALIGARTAAHAGSGVEITSSQHGFTISGFAPGVADVRVVEFDPADPQADKEIQTRDFGKWTGGAVTYRYTCTSTCAVIVQKPGQGEIYASQPIG